MRPAFGSRCPLPPHTRGWTPAVEVRVVGVLASPAHAGMDRSPAWRRSGRRRFPRTRGDGPVEPGSLGWGYELPPHTRGWTEKLARLEGDHGASPAHAGMDPGTVFPYALKASFPRTRGDGPSAKRSCSYTSKLPPHTRGWTLHRVLVALPTVASPAHAGMDLPQPSQHAGIRRFPRTRGDGPDEELGGGYLSGLPPHTRGWTLGLARAIGREMASPAHAGMDRRPSSGHAPASSFPRTRGDGPAECEPQPLPPALPPHTRGWTVPIDARRRDQHASPAHAGMDPIPTDGSPHDGGFPRTRGDGPWPKPALGTGQMLPPHTRGWTLEAADMPVAGLASPAHAGMDRSRARSNIGFMRFPRTRGDGPWGWTW